MPIEKTVKILRRGKTERAGVDEIIKKSAGKSVLVDVGTGDGKFPYREARENPDGYFIGIDPAEKNMVETSGKIGAKPSRGGVENLTLICSTIEDAPDDLSGIADRVTVNFPWGALQRIVVTPEIEGMKKIRMLMKSGATLEVFLNMFIFEDGAVAERDNLPNVDLGYIDSHLRAEYKKLGLEITEFKEISPGELGRHSKWSGKLTKGSGRNSVIIKALAVDGENK